MANNKNACGFKAYFPDHYTCTACQLKKKRCTSVAGRACVECAKRPINNCDHKQWWAKVARDEERRRLTEAVSLVEQPVEKRQQDYRATTGTPPPIPYSAVAGLVLLPMSNCHNPQASAPSTGPLGPNPMAIPGAPYQTGFSLPQLPYGGTLQHGTFGAGSAAGTAGYDTYADMLGMGSQGWHPAANEHVALKEEDQDWPPAPAEEEVAIKEEYDHDIDLSGFKVFQE